MGVMTNRPKRRRQRARRAAYYPYPPSARRHTIHVIDGEVADKPGLDEVPFMGEEMVCILCGQREMSDPRVESNWRGVKLDRAGPIYYACPDEFPPDEGGTRTAFAAAYTRFFEACVEAATNA